jgi:predicted dehydrogenase
MLEQAIAAATRNGTLLWDIMTERYEVGTIMQELIMRNKALFGDLEQGSPDSPAIVKSSVHILDKTHIGVYRPAKYFDVAWQGEGIVDVTTHLVDMANNLLRPNRIILPEDVELLEGRAKRWATAVPPEAFARITKGGTIPKQLDVYCNGSFVYRLDGINIAIGVEWRLEGEDDGHYSKIEGTRVTIEVIKKPEDKHQQVYISPKDAKDREGVRRALTEQMVYKGIRVTEEKGKFKLVIPESMYTTHFQHFAEVTKQALRYVTKAEPFPRDVEYSRLNTKYHLTTAALEMARKG